MEQFPNGKKECGGLLCVAIGNNDHKGTNVKGSKICPSIIKAFIKGKIDTQKRKNSKIDQMFSHHLVQ